MKSQRWYEALAQCKQRGDAFVLVTVLGCTGSTPRDQDAKMVVTAEDSFDTIGGGHLEFKAIQLAREQIAASVGGHRIEHFPLGASLGQCCGGSVSVLLESFAAVRFQVAVFGAGHVAQALIPILGGLECQVRWIDGRGELFPSRMPANVRALHTELPAYEIEHLPSGADVLILTHNHQLDFELCCVALKRLDLRHIGVIGSATKAKRFRQRLVHRGFDAAQIARLNCPIGLTSVTGKLPMEVAVSIAAQLIAIERQATGEQPVVNEHQARRGLAWNDLRRAFDRTSAEPETSSQQQNEKQIP